MKEAMQVYLHRALRYIIPVESFANMVISGNLHFCCVFVALAMVEFNSISRC